MKEITNEEAIEAVRSLQNYCRQRCNPFGDCDCMFFKDNNCVVGVPKDFHNHRKWTDDDIELAKLLKQYGAVAVRRFEHSSTPYWQSKPHFGITEGGYLPKNSFKSLDCNEIINLDDIIDERC